MSSDTPSLLEIEELHVHFPGKRSFFGPKPDPVRAVDGVSLGMGRGEILGLVGESGSGKTTLSRAILGLSPIKSGRVLVDGREVWPKGHPSFNPAERPPLDVQMVFQNPQGALNPRMTVAGSVSESILARRPGLGRRELTERIVAALEEVGLTAEHRGRYPHEFSGGQRQRIAIARALGAEPLLLLADEPVSALDVSVQSQILNLLQELRAKRGLSILLVTHDMAVVRHMADTIAVMQSGKLVESGKCSEVLASPGSDYTRTLIKATPDFA